MVNLDKYDEIIIWGACFMPDEIGVEATSHGGAIGKLYDLLERNGYTDKILFFVDSNKAVWGKKKLGKEVKEPSALLQHPSALVIINSLSHSAILQSMENIHAQNECLFVPYYFYHGVLGHTYDNTFAKEHLAQHKDEIEELYNMEDAHTARYLDIIFQLREKAEDDLYTREFYRGTGENLAYFCDPELAPKGDVTLIDVGAFQGESIEPVRKMYGERLKKCLAFEPDQHSFPNLKLYVEDNHMEDIVDIYPYALGEEDKTIRFKTSGMMTTVSEEGTDQLEQRKFDDLPGVELVGDVMVKMDIEGAEMGALAGMEQMIREQHPYLAICLYHKETDLYDVPKYLSTLYPGYRFYLRGGWHLECWAVPEKHFKN